MFNTYSAIVNIALICLILTILVPIEQLYPPLCLLWVEPTKNPPFALKMRNTWKAVYSPVTHSFYYFLGPVQNAIGFKSKISQHFVDNIINIAKMF